MTSPSQTKSREGLAIVAAALIGAAAVGGGAYWWSVRETSAETVTSQSSTTAATAPTTTSRPPESTVSTATTEPTEGESTTTEQFEEFVDHAVCPSGTPEVICDAAAFVETSRGRAFKDFPLVELASDSDFETRLLSDFDEFAADLEADEATLAALGLIPADSDLAGLFRELRSVGVVGFYDIETQELVIKGDDLDLYAELVIVHELTHAFDDQWFDLDRPELDDLEDDAAYGVSAVIEGNASRVVAAWRSGLSDAEADELSALEFSLLTPEELRRYFEIPTYILSLQISPYVDGEAFVSSVFEAGGEDAVDDLFVDPPTTSEQALHFDKFERREGATEIELEEPAGEVLDEGSLGEIVIREWLGPRAAAGWAGDSYVTWDAGEGERCIKAGFVTDTASDLDELESALAAWAEENFGRSIASSDDGVIATACG